MREEAITVIRGIWDIRDKSLLKIKGNHHQTHGAKRGPVPAHDVAIWVGAYKPHILRLVGRLADGWLPSIQYLPGEVADLDAMNSRIDDAAVAAGREPRAIRRMLNISGRFSATGSGFLDGPPQQWADELTDVALAYGISAFLLASDDTSTTEWYAAEVASAVRRLVAAER